MGVSLCLSENQTLYKDFIFLFSSPFISVITSHCSKTTVAVLLDEAHANLNDYLISSRESKRISYILAKICLLTTLKSCLLPFTCRIGRYIYIYLYLYLFSIVRKVYSIFLLQ